MYTPSIKTDTADSPVADYAIRITNDLGNTWYMSRQGHPWSKFPTDAALYLREDAIDLAQALASGARDKHDQTAPRSIVFHALELVPGTRDQGSMDVEILKLEFISVMRRDKVKDGIHTPQQNRLQRILKKGDSMAFAPLLSPCTRTKLREIGISTYSDLHRLGTQHIQDHADILDPEKLYLLGWMYNTLQEIEASLAVEDHSQNKQG